jgi:pSer/pThr/pTyr-binding forkhead associated (FHA) protein
MGSKNGVFLNETQITQTNRLKNGDKLVIGPLEFFINITIEAKPQKAGRVKSVSDAVARTVALQSEGSQQNQEDTITDWLLAAGESSDELETRTIDSSGLMAHLHSQAGETANREEQEAETLPGTSIKPGTHASSRDAASELLRKFFKGGK